MILSQMNSFGSTILHNGTTLFSQQTINVIPAAPANPLTLPSGEIYDPYSTYPIPQMPGKLSYSLLIAASSPSACASLVNSIVSKIGKKETITAVVLGGAIVTASGRLESIQDTSPISYTLIQRRLQLSFQTYEVFS